MAAAAAAVVVVVVVVVVLAHFDLLVKELSMFSESYCLCKWRFESGRVFQPNCRWVDHPTYSPVRLLSAGTARNSLTEGR